MGAASERRVTRSDEVVRTSPPLQIFIWGCARPMTLVHFPVARHAKSKVEMDSFDLLPLVSLP